jgi:hypothetical protein
MIRGEFAIFLRIKSAYRRANYRWIFYGKHINCASCNGAIKSPKQGTKINVI